MILDYVFDLREKHAPFLYEPQEFDARGKIDVTLAKRCALLAIRSSRCETAGLGAGAWALVARC